jgi:hypothetical protein
LGEDPEHEKGPENLEEFLESRAFRELGIDFAAEEKAAREASGERAELVKRSFVNIRQSIKAAFEAYTQEGVFNYKERDRDEKELGAPDYAKDYSVKIPQEDLLTNLRMESDRAKERHAVTLNMSWSGLTQMLIKGEFKTFGDLTPEQRERLYRPNYENYEGRRKESEQALGFSEDTKVVYGCYSNIDGKEGRRGGAHSYGDCFVEIEPPQGISYTEGDSFNGDDTSVGRRKRSDTGAAYDKVEGRQVLEGQAHIAKAIYNLEEKFMEEYGYRSIPTYIEAQIPNFTTEMIKRINVPNAIAKENILMNLERSQNADAWRDKIKVVDQ